MAGQAELKLDFQPWLFPLDADPHVQQTTLTILCSSSARGQVHKLVRLHVINLSYGSLTVEHLGIVPASGHQVDHRATCMLEVPKKSVRVLAEL